jgi:hypothetical protein
MLRAGVNTASLKGEQWPNNGSDSQAQNSYWTGALSESVPLNCQTNRATSFRAGQMIARLSSEFFNSISVYATDPSASHFLNFRVAELYCTTKSMGN